MTKDNLRHRSRPQTPANFQPLTPLTLLERTAAVFSGSHRDHSRAPAPNLRGVSMRVRGGSRLRSPGRGIKRGGHGFPRCFRKHTGDCSKPITAYRWRQGRAQRHQYAT